MFIRLLVLLLLLAAGACGGSAIDDSPRIVEIPLPAAPLPPLLQPMVAASSNGLVVLGASAAGLQGQPGSDTPHPDAITAQAGAMLSDGRWSSLPPVPGAPLVGSAGVLVEGRISVVGGATDVVGDMAVAAAHVLRAASANWDRLHDLPGARVDATAFADGGRIVVLGGSGPDGPSREILVMEDGGGWRVVDVGHRVAARSELDTHGAMVVAGWDGTQVRSSLVSLDDGLVTELAPLEVGVGGAALTLAIAGEPEAATLLIGGDTDVRLLRRTAGGLSWQQVAADGSGPTAVGAHRMDWAVAPPAVSTDDSVLLVDPVAAVLRDARDGRLLQAVSLGRCRSVASVVRQGAAAVVWSEERCTGSGRLAVQLSIG